MDEEGKAQPMNWGELGFFQQIQSFKKCAGEVETVKKAI